MTSVALPAVFDCAIFAQALINYRGPAGACLSAAQAGRTRLYISAYVVQEVRELPVKLPARLGVSVERVERLILDLAKYAELVADVPEHFAYDRDPDDAHYVNLADAAGAHYLVTRDKDLLDLTTDAAFMARYPQLRIVNPTVFIRELDAVREQ